MVSFPPLDRTAVAASGSLLALSARSLLSSHPVEAWPPKPLHFPVVVQFKSQYLAVQRIAPLCGDRAEGVGSCRPERHARLPRVVGFWKDDGQFAVGMAMSGGEDDIPLESDLWLLELVSGTNTQQWQAP